jgi:Trk K+ transport system NAD-binding subunit
MRDLLIRLVLALRLPLRARGGLLLFAAAAAVAIIGPYAFILEARAVGDHIGWGEALYDALGLFTFASNRFGWPHHPLLRFFYFLAPAVSASALIGAFGKLVAERGSLLVGRLGGHAVVGGLGNLGSTLARHLVRHGHRVIAIERHEEAPGVAELRGQAAATVVVGDMTSSLTLRRARCHRAASVFFTAPSDVANLDAAFHVRRLAREAQVAHPPTVYAHVYDAGLSEALEEHLGRVGEREVRIVPFNSYRFAAKSLLAQLVRDRLLEARRLPGTDGIVLARTRWPEGDAALSEPRGAPAELAEDRRRLLAALRLASLDPGSAALPEDRLAVIGMGRFGRSVARELLDAAPPGARFLIIERSDEHYARSAAAFSDEERARFELYAGDATSAAAGARIAEFRPTAVIVCTDNDLSNLRLAVDLRRRELKAVTRMFDLEASIELGRGLDERGIFTVGLSRLFRAAIPILTHERRILGCVNLDVAHTPEVDHLFYLARVTDEERHRLGDACISLDALPGKVDGLPREVAFVWHRAVPHLGTT